MAELRQQLEELRGGSTPVAAPGAGPSRVDRVRPERASAAQEGPEQTGVRPEHVGTQVEQRGFPPEQPVAGRSCAAETATVGRAGPARPTLKLGTYNGTTPLDTFLAKFENCSGYYSWDARERLFHLRACLEGDAGQILWDAGAASSADELVALLRNRFGSVHQAERYRAELRALRRRRGDSLQVIYQEVRRLMALAFPGQGGTLWEVMARDAFLDALGDNSLRVRILEKNPATLDEALKLACRLEAIARAPPEDVRRAGSTQRQTRTFVDGSGGRASCGCGSTHWTAGDDAG